MEMLTQILKNITGSSSTDNNWLKVTGQTACSDWVISDADDDSSLPVELSAFTATSEDGAVTLLWRTETEVDNVGFSIYRSETAGEDVAGQSHAATSGNYTKIAFVKGAGNTAMPRDYQFTDEGVEPGKTYFYYLEDIDLTGGKGKSDIIELVVLSNPALPIPREFRLLQNYPNPFNPETWIPYQLSENAKIVVRIYDIGGRLVREFDLGMQKAGYYVSKEKVLHWDGRNAKGEQVASGIYIYHLRSAMTKSLQMPTNRKTFIKRLVILK